MKQVLLGILLWSCQALGAYGASYRGFVAAPQIPGEHRKLLESLVHQQHLLVHEAAALQDQVAAAEIAAAPVVAAPVVVVAAPVVAVPAAAAASVVVPAVASRAVADHEGSTGAGAHFLAQSHVQQQQLKDSAGGLSRLRHWREVVADEAVKVSWLHLLAGAFMYVASVMVAAYSYGACFTYAYPQPRLVPSHAAQEGFTFGLFDGLRCDPDWRICCCSCFCTAVRWADTVGSLRVSILAFWQAVVLFACLQVFASTTVIGTLLLTAVGVWARQRIRESYNLPFGDLETLCWDTLVWLFCAPCAVMQEALQIEFVDVEVDAMKEPLVAAPVQDRGLS